jgi:uncharacterized protein YndB with AHSA1/START domain
MSDEPEPVVVDCDLDQPPETVWRALTEPALRTQWLAEADANAEIVGEEPGRSLHLAWRERDEAGDLVESDVTITLTPMISGGTRLRLVHDGFVRTPVMAMARLPNALRRPQPAQLRLRWAA